MNKKSRSRWAKQVRVRPTTDPQGSEAYLLPDWARPPEWKWMSKKARSRWAKKAKEFLKQTKIFPLKGHWKHLNLTKLTSPFSQNRLMVRIFIFYIFHPIWTEHNEG